MLSLIITISSSPSRWSHALEYSGLSGVVSTLIRHCLGFVSCHCQYSLRWLWRSCILISLNSSVPRLWLIYSKGLFVLKMLDSVIIIFNLKCTLWDSMLILLIKRSFWLIRRSRCRWHLLLSPWSRFIIVSIIILKIVQRFKWFFWSIA